MLFTFLAMTGPLADLIGFAAGMGVMVGLPLTHEYLKRGERRRYR